MSMFEIKMPKLGESITEGTIVSWSVKVGDIINEDDVLFEVNTAKVSAEIPSPVAGKITQILFAEGETVAVGAVVALVQLEGEEDGSAPEESSAAVPSPQATTETKDSSPAKVETPVAAEPVTATKPTKGDDQRWYSPVVLQKAKEINLSKEELDALSGTGYLGRLTKKDLEKYIDNKGSKATAPAASSKSATSAAPQAENAAPKAAPATPVATSGGDEVVTMDPIRRIIADRMVASRKISAHVTNVVEVDVTKLVRWRELNKESFKKREGFSLTYMPAITEATAKALAEFPQINASVDGYNIILKKRINVGIAVALNDGNLIVPVIKDANKLNISGLAGAIDSLAAKARKNKLMPDDIQGGTFTITNFGSFKGLFGTPIINQPEVAILGVGFIEKKPAVIETSEGDVIAIRHKMYLSLSYDHRIVDGTLGGNFLRRIADYLENWNE